MGMAHPLPAVGTGKPSSPGVRAQLLTLTVATCRSTGEISGTTTAGDRQMDSVVMPLRSQACCSPRTPRAQQRRRSHEHPVLPSLEGTG